jgi:hypothetical protein
MKEIQFNVEAFLKIKTYINIFDIISGFLSIFKFNNKEISFQL